MVELTAHDGSVAGSSPAKLKFVQLVTNIKMSFLVNKYNIEKIKFFFSKKKFLMLHFFEKNNIKNSVNHFKKLHVKTNFLKNLIKVSVFRRTINIFKNSISLGFLDTSENYNSKLQLNQNLLFLILKKKLYFLKQHISLGSLKFTKKIYDLKYSLKFFSNYNIVSIFFKSLQNLSK